MRGRVEEIIKSIKVCSLGKLKLLDEMVPHFSNKICLLCYAATETVYSNWKQFV